MNLGGLENAAEAFYALDGEWRFTYVSKQAERVLLKSREYLLGKRVWDEFPEKLGSITFREFRRAWEEGVPVEFEEFQPRRGAWFEVRAYPTREGLLIYTRDVTERTRVKRALEESEARLRTTFEGSAMGMALVDRRGRIVDSNPSLRKLLGYSEAELRGAPFAGFALPDNAAADDEWFFKKLLSGRRRSRSLEKRYRRKDGGELWVRLTGSTVQDTEGGWQYAVVMVEDVTEHRQVEANLQEAETRYRTLIEHIPAVLYIQDIKHNLAIAYASPQIKAMLGYTPEEYTSRPGFWMEILHPEDRTRVLTEDARTDETGEPFKVEYRVFTKDGRVVWVRDEAEIVRDANGRPLFWQGFMVDVTERKLTEQRLEAIRQAERRRLARDLHDVALQDLAGVTQALQGAERRRGTGAEPDFDFTEEIATLRRTARNIRQIVLHLRTNEPVTRKPFLDRIEALVESNRRRKPERTVTLEVREGFPHDIPEEAATELERVVGEALTNARRHSAAQSVRVVLSANEGGVWFEVTDDGQGFEPTSVSEGVGLEGMRERIAGLGGRIEVESMLGGGTTVRGCIPA